MWVNIVRNFLWGYVKGRVNAENPVTFKQTNIGQVIAEIMPEMCGIGIGNYFERIDCRNETRFLHLNDIAYWSGASVSSKSKLYLTLFG